MSIMIPSIPQKYTPESGEDKVFYALKDLPGDPEDKKSNYYVFHSFKINQINKETNTFERHETDFVIFHPSKGILCIECKSGPEGKLMKNNNGVWCRAKTEKEILKPNGKMEHGGPFCQAEDRMNELVGYITRQELFLHGNGTEKLKDHCKFMYAVCFPKIEKADEEYTIKIEGKPEKIKFEGYLSAAEPKELVIYGKDLQSSEELKRKIDAIYEYKMKNRKGEFIETGNNGSRLHDEDIQNLFERILYPNFNIVETIDSNTGETKYIQLNEDQIRVLDIMETKKVMAISGWAGTGKTILALEMAKKKALRQKKGERVLFLCINNLMKEELEKLCLSEKIVFKDIGRFAEEVLAGTVLKDKQSFSEKEKQQLQKTIKERIITEKIETIIIDEGQDYNDKLKSGILNALYCVSQDVNEWDKKEETLKEKVERRLNRTADSKQKCFYIFYDEFQTYGDGNLPEFITDIKNQFELDKNYRNTENIVQTAFNPITDHTLDGHCVRGKVDKEEKVKISFYANVEDLRRQLDNILQYLNPDETVILTCKNDNKDDSERSTLLTLPEKELKELFAEEIQENGVKKYLWRKQEDNEIGVNRKEFVFISWEKFKGLEKRNVILIDFEPLRLLNRENEVYYRHFYVGITRAQERVFILSSHSDTIELEEELETDENGEVSGTNITTKTIDAEIMAYKEITPPPLAQWGIDEEMREKYGDKVWNISHDESLMQELDEEMKSKGNCLAFAKKCGVPHIILEEEHDVWKKHKEWEKPIRKLVKEKESVYRKMNPVFVKIVDESIQRSLEEKRELSTFFTRMGIANALYAEDIFESDVVLKELLTNLTMAVEELNERVFEKYKEKRCLKIRFYNDILEMIDFWEFIFGGGRLSGGNTRYGSFKEITRKFGPLANAVEVLTHFLILNKNKEQDYFFTFLGGCLEEQYKNSERVEYEEEEKVNYEEGCIWFSESSIAKEYGNIRVNISVLCGGYQTWYCKFVTNAKKAIVNKDGKIFEEKFWQNFRRLSDLYLKALASVDSLEVLDGLSYLIMEDLKRFDWRKESFFNIEPYPNTLLDTENKVMEIYLKTYAHYLKTYEHFMKGRFSGISIFEPALAIKSKLSEYLKKS